MAQAVSSAPRFAEPYYIVLFESTTHNDPYRQVVDASAVLAGKTTLPYGFDRDLASALPALWYCLHLPRTRFDFISMHALGMKQVQWANLPHHIVLLPVPWPVPLLTLRPDEWPAIVLTPRRLRREAEQLASQLPIVVEVTDTSTLNRASMQRHWKALYAALHIERPRFAWPARLLTDALRVESRRGGEHTLALRRVTHDGGFRWFQVGNV